MEARQGTLPPDPIENCHVLGMHLKVLVNVVSGAMIVIAFCKERRRRETDWDNSQNGQGHSLVCFLACRYHR